MTTNIQNENKISHEQAAKSLGLIKSSISIMINSMVIDILRNMYRNYSSIIVCPKKPELKKAPIEPNTILEPIKPEMPTYLEYLEPKERTEEIQIYKNNRNKYEEDIKSYPYKLKKYNEERITYEQELKYFENDLNNYLIDFKIYEEENEKYEEYKSRLELNEKIKNVYKLWTGMDWRSDNRKVSYSMLIGPPGHGKTTAFKQAAKIVSKALGLRYIEKPVLGEHVDINCFVLTVVNLAGEVSKSTLSGLPSAESDAQGRRYTSMLPSYGMRALQRAGGGILLLDDLTNASEFIQNIALPLTDENTFNELKLQNVYVGITANMGALDGTSTSAMSSALRNRVKPVFVEDTVEDFISRARKTNNDEIGDAYICDFLLQDKSRFISPLPKKDQMGGYATPRSLDNFITVARRHIYDNGGKGVGELKATEILDNDAKSMLGIDLGNDYSTYLAAIRTHAEPLAKKMMLEGKFDKEMFAKGNSTGYDAKSKDFVSLLKAPLVGYAIMALSKGVKKEHVYGYALYLMLAFNKTESFNSLLKYFSTNIALAFEDLSVDSKEEEVSEQARDIIRTRSKTGTALNQNESKKIMAILSHLLKDDSDRLEIYARQAASILSFNDMQEGIIKKRDRIK